MKRDGAAVLSSMVAYCDAGFVQPALRRVQLEGPRSGKVCCVTYYRPMGTECSRTEHAQIEDSKNSQVDKIAVSEIEDSATEFETESD